ncbi:MAG: carboxypeptidase-like regulatory domain-containing protein [Bacillota bacterium]
MSTTLGVFIRQGLSIGRIMGLVAATALAGCGKEKSEPVRAKEQPPTQASVAAAEKPSEAKEGVGVFRGRVTREDGKPISTPGAKVSVEITGIGSKSGERVRYSPKVKEDGSFEIRVTDGTYHRPIGTVQVTYNGKQYQMELARDPDEPEDRESKDGIVQNFIWKMTGPNREAADPKNHTHWHGGTVSLLFKLYRHDLGEKMPAAPTGTKVVTTLTPKGPLIDGSEGKVLTIERIYNRESDSLDNPNLNGIPLGVYTVSIQEVWPDGTRRTIEQRLKSGKYAASHEIAFEPDRLGKPQIAYVEAVPVKK